MSRESCIQHRPNQRIAIVRADYYEITQDHVAAALLNEFEFRANAVLVDAETLPQSVYIGVVLTKKLEAALIHISTDKQIRQRLKWLEEWGFISSKGEKGKPKSYTVHIAKIQERINLGQTTSVKQPRSNNLGQMTALPRSNDRTTSVKQPTEPRSNDDLSIYKKDLLKESSLEEQPEETSQQENLDANPEPKSEVTQYDACQSEAQTDQLPTQNNSLDETNYSAAAPQNEVNPSLAYLHPAQRVNDRFQQRGEIAKWRNSARRNDYQKEFVQYLQKELSKATYYRDSGGCNLAQAKNWLAKREIDEPGLAQIENYFEAFEQHLEVASQKQRQLEERADIPEVNREDAIAGFRRFKQVLDGKGGAA